MLAQKRFPSILIDTQYRMSPAIPMFPSQQFYDGLLKDHPRDRLDNLTRQKMHRFTKSFGIHGPGQKAKQEKDWEGSENMVINVMNGNSRIEVAGTSLVNYANTQPDTSIIDRILS